MSARGATMDVATEHAVLLRHWAGVQARVSQQACEQAGRCAALEAELLRLRARWVVAMTQMLWGLGWPSVAASAARTLAPEAVGEGDSVGDAASVICQTGCAGHAHPWRDEAGACRLTGQDCRPAPPAGLDAIVAIAEGQGAVPT